jgi:hypothetical protein
MFLKDLQPRVVVLRYPVRRGRLGQTETRVLGGLFDAYSPAVGPDGQVYLGGWTTAADSTNFLAALHAGADPATILGPDKIYATARGETPHLAFQKIGYSVNDPTFQGATMLYTQLSNAAQVAGGRAIFEQNELGRAILVNGVWQDLGTAEAAAAGGGGGHGVWSPAVAGGYVYYSSGTDVFSSSIDYRQPLGADGLPTGPPEHLSFPNNLQLTNIDVLARGAGDWHLVGNTLDQHAIVYLRSRDGVDFFSPVTLLADPTGTLLSPQFEPLSGTQYNLLFSRGGTEIDRLGPLTFLAVGVTLVPPTIPSVAPPPLPTSTPVAQPAGAVGVIVPPAPPAVRTQPFVVAAASATAWYQNPLVLLGGGFVLLVLLMKS